MASSFSRADSPGVARRLTWIALVAAIGIIESSCGDVYRPVAQIIPGTPPNPAAVHFVAAVSTNGAPQVWAVARSDSQRIYVLDANGSISAINTLSDMVMPNSPAASAGAGANFMFLDSKAQRLYVTNPVAHTLSIFDISESIPNPPVSHLVTLDLSQSASPAYVPVSVTGIGDGSRAY